ncbi:hypothetical protein [Mycolicibacterium sp.]|uniref:hypothetical protein n=1 Tax=Mycolicibacterium sp. TaxID=2320850 RepID=UPI003D11A372
MAGLTTAGERFDQGQLVEAKMLAAQIRRLVHRSGASRALLEEFGLTHRLTWVDTAGVLNPKIATSAACLTLMKIRTRTQAGGEYVPKLGLYPPAPIRTRSGGHIDRGSRIPFEHWWTNPVVKDADGFEYSRKQLVLAVAGAADDDGDPETGAALEAVAGSPSLGPAVLETGTEPTVLAQTPVMASVRQIGYEVLQSISQQRDIIDECA